MSKFRLAHLGLVMAAIGFTAATPVIGLGSLAYAADTVRAEVGKPLQEAQKLTSAGKNKEALAKLREADNVSGKTAFESYQIERVRASAAAGAGDNATAIKAFEAVINSGRLSAAEAPKFTQGLAGMYYRAKDWPNAITWFKRSLKDRDDQQTRDYLIQAYYSSGNYAEAAKELQSKGGNSEASLQMLANIQLKQNDKAGYVSTLEKLATSYPKSSYWADLLNRVSGKPGFSQRLGLDVQRLRLANGLFTKPSEYMELSQLALQAGNPGEALSIIDQGYKKGVLGTGADAARHQRLKDLALKTQAELKANAAKSEAEYVKNKDADALSKLGFALVYDGQADKGLGLMNDAVKMGTAKYPEEAKLHLGIAYIHAGKKANANTALKTVKGTDGAADLARYWTLMNK
ncbi:tetratricopeptide repeat protein [Janthinobacterium psychrotolerans]|uniref:Tetratricopeptide repeat-containing protein n=1 Tax=Janthinobacterium psychrotolerans TaxID=1747903 RepID=A0A1A7C475_9BURK|nr:tetratricopeptide repeat protein [Janthinobacterium psychrotolerans]OBV40512.1 Tetratricopeptide repeat-containing protein [Janthinobacterium psychrotolerans]